MTQDDLVALIDPDGKPTDIIYKILGENDDYTRLAHSENGNKLRVHNSRVLKTREDIDKQIEKARGIDSSESCNNLETTPETIGCEAKEVNETRGNEMTDATETAEVTEAETETTKTETTETTEATEAEKPKKAKKAKAKKEMEPFDIAAFIAENGGEHWVKGKVDKIKFDHDGYEVLTHAILDEAKKVYRVFNTYSLKGVVSLGRGGKGITVYPLKGKTVNYTVSKNAKKVESRGEKKQRKGAKTAEEVRKTWEKNGYQKQE